MEGQGKGERGKRKGGKTGETGEEFELLKSRMPASIEMN
jgi:hypothetical protein